MLTPHQITFFTLVGSVLLSLVFIGVAWRKHKEQRVHEAFCLMIIGNTFSAIPLACMVWNVVFGAYVAAWGSVEASEPGADAQTQASIGGNETIIFLALVYALFVIGNGIRRSIWD